MVGHGQIGAEDGAFQTIDGGRLVHEAAKFAVTANTIARPRQNRRTMGVLHDLKSESRRAKLAFRTHLPNYRLNRILP